MRTVIQPVQVFPGTANTLSIRGVGPVDDSGRPNYLWELLDVQLVKAAIPAVPATDEDPGQPASPAEYSSKTLAAGNKEMTKDQWDNWGKTPTDEAYQLGCLLANLGLSAKK